MVSIEIDYLQCWGARVVRAKQTDFLNEGCGVRVERKVLTYPRNFVAGGAARIYAPVSTLLPYASLVRVSRKSVLLDDRRRGRRSVILELGEASYNPPRWHVCCDAFSKVSGKCQVAPEVNKIRPLASAISPADTIPH